MMQNFSHNIVFEEKPPLFKCLQHLTLQIILQSLKNYFETFGIVFRNVRDIHSVKKLNLLDMDIPNWCIRERPLRLSNLRILNCIMNTSKY